MADQHRIDAYASAVFEVAKAEDELDEVEDELFRFARSLEANDALREMLTDPAIPVTRRLGVISDLLGHQASTATLHLVSLIVGAGRARELPAIADKVVAMAAAERQHVVAEVRSAVPLDDDQKVRLAEALSRATGKSVEIKVVVDPTVLGGLVAEVGDTVIDGTVRSRLERLRSQHP